MQHTFKVLLFAAAAGFAAVPSSAGYAATQSLALLETDGAIPLVCHGGICKAEFSTFCLQKELDLPRSGDPFTLADGGAVTLVLTSADGSVKREPATTGIQIKAARSGHTAVTIAVPLALVEKFDTRHIAIEIGERVTLMPVPFVGDDNPQTEQDKHLVNGPLRQLGQQIVEQGPHDVERVQVLNRLINALPEAIDMRANAKQTLWHRATKSSFQDAAPQRVARAAKEYDSCWQDRVVALFGYSVRRCLQRRHDGLMWQHVKRYWGAVGTGS